MNGYLSRNKKGFVGLVEILAVLVIITLLMYFFIKRFSTGSVISRDGQQITSEQGIDTTNSKTIVDSTRNKIKEISENQAQQFNQLYNSDNSAGNATQF